MPKRNYNTATHPARRHLRREVARVFGLLAILLNLAAGLAISTRPHGESLEDRAFRNGWTVICSSAGLRVVDADGEPVDASETDGASHSLRCVFCLPLMHGDVLAAAPSLLHVVIAHAIGAPFVGPPRDDVPSTRPEETWPRGPPPSAMI